MKSKQKVKIIIVVLGLVFAMSTISNYNFSDDQGNNDGISVEIRDETNLNSPKKSGAYTESFIHIDGNWSDAIGKGWFSGDGSCDNPYTIENITIDASSSPIGCGILINNSKNDYFTIYNCTIYNAMSGQYLAGIKLENTNNGTLKENECNDNGINGILLYKSSSNNTLIGNILNRNTYGIRLENNCNNNTISNHIFDNSFGPPYEEIGIYLHSDCDHNDILENEAYWMRDFGIYLYDDCDFNNLTRNEIIASMGGLAYGIGLEEYCDNNHLESNILKNNNDDGINFMGNQNNNNTLINNIVTGSDGDGIELNYCNYTQVIGNIANSSDGYGILLGGYYNTITGNVANDNARGFYIGAIGCVISKNIAKINKEDGINIEGCNHSTIFENIANENGENGINLIFNSYRNNISKNIAIDNNLAGLTLVSCTETNISDNILRNNGETGLTLTGRKNIISDNKILKNEDFGIVLNTNSDNNNISNNVINNNNGTGIYIETNSDLNSIFDNYIYNNTEMAIDIKTNANSNKIRNNILASNLEHFIRDIGIDNEYKYNYYGRNPPSFNIDLINQTFTKSEFILLFSILSQANISFISNFSIDIIWNDIPVSQGNIFYLGNSHYRVLLDPFLVKPEEAAILLEITVNADYHTEITIQMYYSVDPAIVEDTSGDNVIENGDDDDDDDDDDEDNVLLGFGLVSTISAIGAVTVISVLLINKRLKLKREN
ncbi:MAG: right-handed parallel beta-helix repeat-containing protein [Promethearchaeota archaeon]